jgi:protein-ribulosamine 3-kinase
MHDWSHIAGSISEATDSDFKFERAIPMGGGCINQAVRLEGSGASRYFVKLNDARHYSIFTAEAEGLDAIASTHTLRVPRPIAHGTSNGKSFLVLEFLELGSRGDARRLGEQLAALHRCTAERYGFPQDNFIGTTHQHNGWHEDWVEFWRGNRLGFQLKLAAEKGYGGKLQDLGRQLQDRLPGFFDNYHPQPSLLHGDLWGGNHAYLRDGTPAIFDPAAYYGDREADIAMTELFGGYPAEFYSAYQEAWPLEAGYATRCDLYNLYHILNHANLFGGGYALQAENIMQQLLAHVR